MQDNANVPMAIGRVQKQPKQYQERSVSRRNSGAVTWSAVDAGELAHFVHKMTEAGAGVILSVTTDGGALSITVLSGNTRFREWPSSADEALDVMHQLIDEIT